MTNHTEQTAALIDRLRNEAQIHAQEARTANATIAEIYRIVTGGTGEPGNWHGAEPVRKCIEDLRAATLTLPAAASSSRAGDAVTNGFAMTEMNGSRREPVFAEKREALEVLAYATCSYSDPSPPWLQNLSNGQRVLPDGSEVSPPAQAADSTEPAAWQRQARTVIAVHRSGCVRDYKVAHEVAVTLLETALAPIAAEAVPPAGYENDIELIQAVLRGYPQSMARSGAERAVHRLSSRLTTLLQAPAVPVTTESHPQYGERCAPNFAQHNGVKTHERRTEDGNRGTGKEGAIGGETARSDAACTSSVERCTGSGRLGSGQVNEGEYGGLPTSRPPSQSAPPESQDAADAQKGQP